MFNLPDIILFKIMTKVVMLEHASTHTQSDKHKSICYMPVASPEECFCGR